MPHTSASLTIQEIGLLLVWQVFGRIFQPVFSFALSALYLGQGLGG